MKEHPASSNLIQAAAGTFFFFAKAGISTDNF
jgi:hypothetical protein